uniref:Uncharacterized protein LOC110204541 n=1 Tax=Phascolarctos cinereus TaxID=38626 RepID=A0A6P5JXE4_PHACI
ETTPGQGRSSQDDSLAAPGPSSCSLCPRSPFSTGPAFRRRYLGSHQRTRTWTRTGTRTQTRRSADRLSSLSSASGTRPAFARRYLGSQAKDADWDADADWAVSAEFPWKMSRRSERLRLRYHLHVDGDGAAAAPAAVAAVPLWSASTFNAMTVPSGLGGGSQVGSKASHHPLSWPQSPAAPLDPPQDIGLRMTVQGTRFWTSLALQAT